jgi:hypothetical protein
MSLALARPLDGLASEKEWSAPSFRSRAGMPTNPELSAATNYTLNCEEPSHLGPQFLRL